MLSCVWNVEVLLWQRQLTKVEEKPPAITTERYILCYASPSMNRNSYKYLECLAISCHGLLSMTGSCASPSMNVHLLWHTMVRNQCSRSVLHFSVLPSAPPVPAVFKFSNSGKTLMRRAFRKDSWRRTSFRRWVNASKNVDLRIFEQPQTD